MDSNAIWKIELQELQPYLASSQKLCNNAFAEGLALDPEKRVSEWSDQNRVLSKAASAEPGRWSTERTPYLREPMDMLSSSEPIAVVVLQKPTQIGGTEAGNNWIGSIIDQGLGPTMMVLPTSNSGKKASRTLHRSGECWRVPGRFIDASRSSRTGRWMCRPPACTAAVAADASRGDSGWGPIDPV